MEIAPDQRDHRDNVQRSTPEKMPAQLRRSDALNIAAAMFERAQTLVFKSTCGAP
jgi:hypothetical protein